jgi:hypothetical protein
MKSRAAFKKNLLSSNFLDNMNVLVDYSQNWWVLDENQNENKIFHYCSEGTFAVIGTENKQTSTFNL